MSAEILGIRTHKYLSGTAPVNVMAVMFVVCVSSLSIDGDSAKILALFPQFAKTPLSAIGFFQSSFAVVLILFLIGLLTAGIIYLLGSTLGSTGSWFPATGALLVVSTSLDSPLRYFLAGVGDIRAGPPLLIMDSDFLYSVLLITIFLIFIMGRANTLRPWMFLCATLITFASVLISPRIALFAAVVMGVSSMFELLRFRKIRWTIGGGFLVTLAVFLSQNFLHGFGESMLPQTVFEISPYHLAINLVAPLLAVVIVSLSVSADYYEVLWRFRHVWTLYVAELLILVGGKVGLSASLALGPEFILIHIFYWAPVLALIGRSKSFSVSPNRRSHGFSGAVRGIVTLLPPLLERVGAPLLVALLLVYMSAGGLL